MEYIAKYFGKFRVPGCPRQLKLTRLKFEVKELSFTAKETFKWDVEH